MQGREYAISPYSIVRKMFTSIEPHYFSLLWNRVVDDVRRADALDDIENFRPAPDEPALLLPVSREGIIQHHESMTNEELAKSILEETKKFVGIIKSDLGFELDYSLDSLKFIDYYVASLSAKVDAAEKKSDVRLFVYLIGNYIGEVFRRKYGGKWVFNDKDSSAGLVLQGVSNGGAIFPHRVAANLAMDYYEGAVMAYAKDLHKKIVARV